MQSPITCTAALPCKARLEAVGLKGDAQLVQSIDPTLKLSTKYPGALLGSSRQSLCKAFKRTKALIISQPIDESIGYLSSNGMWSKRLFALCGTVTTNPSV